VDLTGADGCTQITLDILEGTVPDDIPKYPNLVLEQFKRIRQPISFNFTFKDMCSGFGKWREQTTTSPSGKHLGIYTALVAARKYSITTTSESTTSQYDTLDNTASKCQNFNTSSSHSPYSTVTRTHDGKLSTTSSKKIPGVPKLDKLRVIHLYEPDWSIIQNFYVSHKLTTIACNQQIVPIKQAGGTGAKFDQESCTQGLHISNYGITTAAGGDPVKRRQDVIWLDHRKYQ
jgi:hypothetical protein